MTVENVHASGRVLGDINVTPMIDVLLVLLIIFMVIAPVMPRGLSAALPQRPANPLLHPEAPIVLQIISTHNGLPSYKINQVDVSNNELQSRLISILSNRAEKVMFVKADDDLEFSTIAKVIALAKGAGADHIGLITPSDRL